MPKRYGQLGEILVKLGLITPDDVDRALAYQQQRGGYLGDALVQLGLLTPDQVRWALADQFDVPFVQIRPENIDRATAMAVPAAWAREHLILPVLRDGDTVTVILADPTMIDHLDEVRRFTRADRVEAALSNAATLRDLIDAVYGEGIGPPVEFGQWIAEAMASGAEVIGISARGERMLGWSRRDETATQRLQSGWSADLIRAVSPFPSAPSGEVRSWPAVLSLNGSAWRIECTAAGDGAVIEWAARLGPALPTGFPRLRVDDDTLAAVRRGMQADGLVVRIAETDAAPRGVLEALVAALPISVCDVECRSVHLADRPVAVPQDVLAVPVGDSLEAALASLALCAPGALSIDVREVLPAALDAARRISRLVILRTRSTPPPTSPIDLTLHLRASGDELFWTSDKPH